MTAEVPIRVLLADDHRLVRSGIRLILETEEGLEVVGEAADGGEAIDEARRLVPDVVCMDVQMPHLDGVAATRVIGDELPGVRVLMLTTFHDEQAVHASLRAGASGFVLKNSPPETLLAAIRAVHAGDALLDPQITRQVIERMRLDAPAADAAGLDEAAASREPAAELERLTDREREVLLLVAEGLSNAEIAGRLYVSDATVKTHVSNLLAKLGVHDRIHAVIWSYEHGLVGPGSL